MKRLLIFLLLLPSLAWGEDYARMNPYVLGGGVSAAGETCGDASGLVFRWSCENTTVTSGTPAGCSSGDTSAGTYSGESIDTDGSPTRIDGSGTCSYPTANDRYVFDVSSGDIVSSSAGTVIGYFYLADAAWVDGVGVWKAYIDANNLIRFGMSSTDGEAVIEHKGTGTPKFAVTSGANIAQQTWYRFVVKWSAAGVSEDGTKYLYVQVCDAATLITCTEAYGTDALSAFTGSFGASSLQFGEVQGVASASNGDYYRVYNVWK